MPLLLDISFCPRKSSLNVVSAIGQAGRGTSFIGCGRGLYFSLVYKEQGRRRIIDNSTLFLGKNKGKKSYNQGNLNTCNLGMTLPEEWRKGQKEDIIQCQYAVVPCLIKHTKGHPSSDQVVDIRKEKRVKDKQVQKLVQTQSAAASLSSHVTCPELLRVIKVIRGVVASRIIHLTVVIVNNIRLLLG